MNILVIGNGFDIAHGLPTKYTEFLEFCKRISPIYENEENKSVLLYQQEYLDNWAVNVEIKDFLKTAYESREKIKDKINETHFQTKYMELDGMYLNLKNNFWIDYFLQCNKYRKENWIDFECEISKVIQIFEIVYKKIGDSDLFDKIEKWQRNKIMQHIDKLKVYLITKSTKKCFKSIIKYMKTLESHPPISDVIQVLDISKIEKNLISLINDKAYYSNYEYAFEKVIVNSVKEKYEEDLNKLIVILENYLCLCILKIKIQYISPDIKNIEFAKVLSFNYTDTYIRVYKNNSEVEFDYIHGKIRCDGEENNNMVLGIDEYLPDDRKDKDIEFIAFKKYYQRIYKQTGCKYKEWVDAIKDDYSDYLHEFENVGYMEQKNTSDNMQKMINRIAKSATEDKKCLIHNLYIFGHSLDITDRDIIRDLILNDNVYTTIFYPNKKELGRKIANLVKVIGQDELIRRTGGSTKTIEFKLQQEMELRESP